MYNYLDLLEEEKGKEFFEDTRRKIANLKLSGVNDILLVLENNIEGTDLYIIYNVDSIEHQMQLLTHLNSYDKRMLTKKLSTLWEIPVKEIKPA